MMIRSFLVIVAMGVFGLNSFASPAMEKRETTNGMQDELEKLIYTVRLKVPYGNSDWSDTFTPTGANPLKIRLLAEGSCGSGPGMFVYVRKADTGNWEQTVFQNGLDNYSGGKINGLRFQMVQNHFSNITCTFNVYANENASEPITSNGSLIGAINYTGGFQQNASIDIAPSLFVKGLSITVPAFCEGVSILEASTVTEGVVDKATLIEQSQNYYSVNNGAGSRISRITIAVNGPIGSHCQLPVYVYEK